MLHLVLLCQTSQHISHHSTGRNRLFQDSIYALAY